MSDNFSMSQKLYVLAENMKRFGCFEDFEIVYSGDSLLKLNIKDLDKLTMNSYMRAQQALRLSYPGRDVILDMDEGEIRLLNSRD